MDEKISNSLLDLLMEREGVFTIHNQRGVELKRLGLIDVEEISFDRFKWKINEKGQKHLPSQTNH